MPAPRDSRPDDVRSAALAWDAVAFLVATNQVGYPVLNTALTVEASVKPLNMIDMAVFVVLPRGP